MTKDSEATAPCAQDAYQAAMDTKTHWLSYQKTVMFALYNADPRNKNGLQQEAFE